MALFKNRSGVNVEHNKNTENCETVVMPAPKRVIIPLNMHIGRPAVACVKKGDVVKVGDLIATADGNVSANVHSPVSGKVFSVEMAMSGTGKAVCITIDADGEQTVSENVKAPEVSDYDSFIAAIKESGLVGLGGAGFPTAVKLSPKNLDEVKTLVVNAAECEPYLTADYREMMENGEDVIAGAKAVKEYLGLEKVIIAVEENKPQAIAKMTELAKDAEGFSVKTLKPTYPQGAEKVLIEKVCGIEVPKGKLPCDVGVIVLNVTTVGFIARYLATGMPLVAKRVTVDGDAVAQPKNVLVPIGTPVKDLVEFCGGYSQDAYKITYGGPMMGIALPNDEVTVLKHTNGILVFGKDKATLAAPSACIRCGRCIKVCPMGLSPVEMVLAHSINAVDELKALNVDLCIECGCCAYECPANRPITQTLKEAKEMVRKAGK